MVMVQHLDQEFSMDGYLHSNLTRAKEVIRKDLDMMFCVDGPEGSGKSVFTIQCAYVCDPTFNIDRIVFTPSELRKRIIESEPYQAIVYDEAYTGLSSRATMSLINRTIISMLAEIRQKNLFIFIVMPSFFDLDRYVALWRSRALIHVYFAENFQRGYFAFYDIDLKKYLYIEGKKYYSYSKPRPNFIGRFTNYYCVNEKDYRKKKYESLKAREKDETNKAAKQEIEQMMFERLQNIDDRLSHTVKMNIMGLPAATYFRKLKQYNDSRENS